MKNSITKILLIAFLIVQIFSFNINLISAKEKGILFDGKIYELNKKSDYSYSEKDKFENSIDNSLGKLTLNGEINNSYDSDGIPCYSVSSDNVSFTYTINELNTKETKWHVVKDNSKKVNGLKLKDKVEYGALIVQTSKDSKKWITEYTETNIFNDKAKSKTNFYETNDVQLTSGTYYRVLVAYKMRIKTDESKVLFVKTKNYEYKKCLEVYEFYLYDRETEQYANVNKNKYRLGEVKNTGKDNGYSDSKNINEDDPHYGWNLGNFFVKGYTRCIAESNETPVFLKNVGDKVTLYFNLSQDIDCLNGNEKLSISNDINGYDKYFQTEKIGFGRGTLIIRFTDHENVSHVPNIYTNYLEARISPNADTEVQLCEEGDYEVSLNYEIKNSKMLSEYDNYKINFKFSVRNGNSMVFSFDSLTNEEILNGSTTLNGFKLDLAQSKYLDVNIKKEILTSNSDGIIEDTRYNRPAKDGEVYTDPGIYTISVTNRYTKKTTTKKICVGDNQLMRAYMKTGMTIESINKMLSEGATIDEDGSIIALNTKDEIIVEELPKDEIHEPTNESSSDNGLILIVLLIGATAIFLGFSIVIKKKQGDK